MNKVIEWIRTYWVVVLLMVFVIGLFYVIVEVLHLFPLPLPESGNLTALVKGLL